MDESTQSVIYSAEKIDVRDSLPLDIANDKGCIDEANSNLSRSNKHKSNQGLRVRLLRSSTDNTSFKLLGSNDSPSSSASFSPSQPDTQTCVTTPETKKDQLSVGSIIFFLYFA
ncbi:unnamed protein product [Protopolystoma xenopodis]|uniref:Uncharacterized protein n=1 Tax=Protopolystoma xenopodis TaxID=117903 RepID=A0A3S5AUV5_9PLAT|nr:unnamed protein product [Protopolystoma xenopodis]